MPRVLHLIWRIDGGGIEQFCLNLLRNMRSNEYSFDFAVCGDRCNGENDNLLSKSIIYHLPLINGTTGKKQYLYELRNILYKTQYDIVHSHMAFMNISTLRIAKKCGVPIRISHTHVAGFGNRNSIKNIVKRQLMNYYATKCFACSHDSAEFYYGVKNKKISVLYSGIEISRFCNSSGKDRNLFVVVARVCPEKSPEFILDVAEKLYQKNSKLRFLWCGGGDGLSQLEEEASKRMIPIMFRGWVPDVENYLKNASYMLMPSKKEGFGMTAVEAQLSGVLVFASDRVPRDTDLGLIECYPLDSAEKWADRIFSIIDNDDKRKYRLKHEKIRDYDISNLATKVFGAYKNE